MFQNCLSIIIWPLFSIDKLVTYKKLNNIVLSSVREPEHT